MTWKSFNQQRPQEDRVVLVKYCNDVYICDLEFKELTDVFGKKTRVYYLKDRLTGGYFSEGLILALHPDMQWMYPKSLKDTPPAEYESNMPTAITVEVG